MRSAESQSNPFNYSAFKFTPDFSAFNPYSTLFNQLYTASPSIFAQRYVQNQIEMQQHLWQGTMEWTSWQQKVWQQNALDANHYLTHFMQLTNDPNVLYRYARMNWQKPYLTLSSQALTSARMLTGVITEYWSNWQKNIMGSMQH